MSKPTPKLGPAANGSWLESEPVIVYCHSVVDNVVVPFIGQYVMETKDSGEPALPAYWTDVYGVRLHNVVGWSPIPKMKYEYV